MIKRLLKYGAVAGASFVAGTIAQVHYLNHKAKGNSPNNKSNTVWEGETATVYISVEHAHDMLDVVHDVIQESAYINAYFVEEDLRSIRTELSHSISDLNQSENYVQIELSDRERLRLIDHYLGSPEMKTGIFEKIDYTDKEENPK